MEPDIVQTILDQSKGKTYLEIGVEHGHSFWPIRTKRKFGVDPNPTIKLRKIIFRKVLNSLRGKQEKFFKLTSDQFFSNHFDLFEKDKIDVALIDGLHTYRQSLRDVLNCLKHLNEKGIIVLDDCNPISKALAWSTPSPEARVRIETKPSLTPWTKRWYGEVWKTIVYLRSCRNDLHVFVLNTSYGIGIVARGKPENQLSYSPEAIDRLSYEDLESQREKFLNLKKPDYLLQFLKKRFNPIR